MTICGGTATAVHRAGSGDASLVRSLTVPLGGGLMFIRDWTAEGRVRQPDVACVANSHVAIAWFERVDGDRKVRVRTGAAPAQAFGLGSGSVSRGLSIATSTD